MLQPISSRDNIQRGMKTAHTPLKLANSDTRASISKNNNQLRGSSPIKQPPVLTRPSSPLRCKSPTPNAGNVKVAVRVRPLLEKESAGKCLVSMAGPDTILDADPTSTRHQERRTFTFDRSFWSADTTDSNFSSQSDVYELFGREFLDHSLEGYNACIFAYGQTGSGKSYTMLGSKNEPGIIPQLCRDLFDRVDKFQGISNISVRMSYCEIYNEQVRDLLSDTKSPSGLRIRENANREPYVEGLGDFPVKSVDQVLKYLERGNSVRATASTNVNSHSSRSHAVFSLEIRQLTYENGGTDEKTSLLRLVDLAGSERANATGATGERLREGTNINKSLVTLGRVISGLAAGRRSTTQVIPYRESVLTRLLQDSLGGNSKTAMIACISPTSYEQTLSTLRYAVQAKSITTQARVNHDRIESEEQTAKIEEMQKQLKELQLRLSERNDIAESEVIAKVAATVRFYEDRAALLETRCLKLEQQNDRYAEQLERMGDASKDSAKKFATIGNDRIAELVSEYTQFGQSLTQTREAVSNNLDKWTKVLADI